MGTPNGELDNPHELIDVINRALASDRMREGDGPPLICVRLDAEDGSEHDGDMLRIIDVVVEPDEVNAHIEIRVRPDSSG